MKHLALDFIFVREKVTNKELENQHIPNSDRLVDLLTKPLANDWFLMFLNKIGVSYRSSILWGNIKDTSSNVSLIIKS